MEQSVDRYLIREYLLGRLNDASHVAEQEKVESYFEDEELFEDLLEVENELLEQFVRGQLPPDENKAFKYYLDRLPDGREKLAFTEALMKSVDTEPATSSRSVIVGDMPARAPVPDKRSPWRWNLALQYGFAAGLILFGLFIIQQLRSENGQLREQLAVREAEHETLRQKSLALERQLKTGSEQTEKLQAELDESRLQHQDQERKLERLRSSTPSLIHWTLFPTSGRDPFSQPQSVRLTKTTGIVAITLQIEESGRYEGYQATLQKTDSGEIIWKQQEKRSLMIDRELNLQLPASLFTESNYKLALELIESDASPLPPAYYYFMIANR